MLLKDEKLLYIGLLLMAVSLLFFVVGFVVFRIRDKRLRKVMEKEYGKLET